MHPTPETFLRDVAAHTMTVLRDEGLYRHLRFHKSGTRILSFDLLTWPGHLCYTGDMGTYVFSRLDDMFEFFRPVSPWTPPIPPTLPINQDYWPINQDYWAQKCLARDPDGIKTYSPARFVECVREWLDDHQASPAVRTAVHHDILPIADEGEDLARAAVRDFHHPSGFTFADFWEADLTVYTPRFTWCCYALVWGILHYDHHRSPTPVPLST